MSIYTDLLAAGVPLDNHESDLYAKVTDDSQRIVLDHLQKSSSLNVKTFSSNIDGSLWYDISFAYDPWWKAKEEAGKARETRQA